MTIAKYFLLSIVVSFFLAVPLTVVFKDRNNNLQIERSKNTDSQHYIESLQRKQKRLEDKLHEEQQKQAEPAKVTQAAEARTVAATVSKPPVPQVKGDCHSEIMKYDWPIDTAVKVMTLESHNVPTKINNNPSTGDYSVGCFQVNLIGAMRNTRPSEQSLLNPAVNVKWAYEHYVKEGRTFCKSSGWQITCQKLGLI